MVSSDKNGWVKIWDAKKQTLIGSSYETGLTTITSIKFSDSNENLILVIGKKNNADTKTLQQWDISTGKKYDNLSLNPSSIKEESSKGIVPIQERLKDAFANETLVDNKWYFVVPIYDNYNYEKYISEGKESESPNDGKLELWSVKRGEKIATLIATLKGHSRRVNRVIFSPNGEQFVTLSYDFTARLWVDYSPA